jgi:hypothetical protein
VLSERVDQRCGGASTEKPNEAASIESIHHLTPWLGRRAAAPPRDKE